MCESSVPATCCLWVVAELPNHPGLGPHLWRIGLSLPRLLTEETGCAQGFATVTETCFTISSAAVGPEGARGFAGRMRYEACASHPQTDALHPRISWEPCRLPNKMTFLTGMRLFEVKGYVLPAPCNGDTDLSATSVLKGLNAQR